MNHNKDSRYFGKSAFSDLHSVADAARKVMLGEDPEEKEKEETKETTAQVLTEAGSSEIDK